MASPFVEVPVGDRVVKITNPDKVYFPARGGTRLDIRVQRRGAITLGDVIDEPPHEMPPVIAAQGLSKTAASPT